MEEPTLADVSGKAPFLRGFPVSRVAAFTASLIARSGWLVLCLTMAALYFLPVLKSSLGNDDTLFAYARAQASLEHLSPKTVLGEDLTRLGRAEAQATPFRMIPVSLWLVTPSIAFAKLLQYAFVLANVATLAVVSRQLFRSSGGAVLTTALAICCWQLRYPHDPTLQSLFQWPWTAEFVLLSLSALLKWLEHRKMVYALLAIGASLVALLSQPGIWPVVSLLVLLLSVPSPKKIRVLIGCMFLTIVVAIAFVSNNGGLQNRHLSQHAKTVSIQLLAAVPTSYRAVGNVAVDGINGSLRDSRFDSLPDVQLFGWATIFVIALGASLGLSTSTIRAMKSGLTSTTLVTVAALWFGGALCIPPRTVWRGGLPPGQAFDPVYLEQFGVAIGAAWVIIRIVNRPKASLPLARVAVALTTFLLCFGNVRANSFAINKLERRDLPRTMIQRAASDGLFKRLHSGSIVVVTPDLHLYDDVDGTATDARFALYAFTGRDLQTVSLRDIRVGGRLCAEHSIMICEPSRQNVYVLSTHYPIVIHPQVSLTHWVRSDRKAVYGDQGFGYVRYMSRNITRYAKKLLTSPQHGLAITKVERVSETALTFATKRTCEPAPINDVFAPETPTITWGAGFDPPTTIGEIPYYEIGAPPMRGAEPLFRWAGRSATLIVRRDACAPVSMKVDFAVDTSEPGPITTRWTGGLRVEGGAAHNLRFFDVRLAPSKTALQKIVVSTNDAPFEEERWRVRIEGDPPREHRMIVVTPTVGDLTRPPLPDVLDPTGGLL